MNSLRSQRGAITLGVAALIAATLVVGAWLFKPKALDGDSRRAQQSTEATAALLEAQRKQGATAAAKITTVNEVAATLPDSSEKTFIQLETGSALGDLPKPDTDAKFASLERKLAVLSGDIQKTNELYQRDREQSIKLQTELNDTIAERDRIDVKLMEVANLRLGAERQRNVLIAIVILAALVIGYLKFFGVNKTTLGKMVAGIRAGEDPIQVFDTHLAPWMHNGVNRAARLATPSEDV